VDDLNKEFLAELDSFIKFAYLELENVKLKNHLKRKKTVLLPMYINACDLAESIKLLLDNERVNASQNLIRSLQETWINIRFIFINGNNLWVDSYLYESDLDVKKFAKGLKELRKKYPDVDMGNNTFTDSKLSVLENRGIKFESELVRKYSNLPQIPGVNSKSLVGKPYNLREKTAITDHILAEKRKPKTLNYSDEWQYFLVYRYLSGGSHINATYLANNIAQKSKTGLTVWKHGKKENIPLCAWTTLSLLYDITTVFSKQFGYPKYKDLRKYQKTINALKDKIEG
jgi:hypothetical protein